MAHAAVAEYQRYRSSTVLSLFCWLHVHMATKEGREPPSLCHHQPWVWRSVFFNQHVFFIFYNVLHRKLLHLICSGLLHKQHPDITCHLGNSRWYTTNQQQHVWAEGPCACMFCLFFVSKCDLQNKTTQIWSKHFLAQICFGLKH